MGILLTTSVARLKPCAKQEGSWLCRLSSAADTAATTLKTSSINDLTVRYCVILPLNWIAPLFAIVMQYSLVDVLRHKRELQSRLRYREKIANFMVASVFLCSIYTLIPLFQFYLKYFLLKFNKLY
jgi:hypothetical protein